jgi:hypothetical protein
MRTEGSFLPEAGVTSCVVGAQVWSGIITPPAVGDGGGGISSGGGL